MAYQDGDRLVVETGYRKHENATTSRTGTTRYGGTIGGTDLPEDETTTTDSTPWIEFADTLTFKGEVDFITSATATVTGTSVSVSVPAGTINGDLMILSLGHAIATGLGAFTPPAGWTKLDSPLSQTNYAYRIASAEPASYTVSWSTSGDCAVGIATFRGADTTDPILAVGSRAAGNATAWACQPLFFLATTFTEFTHCALGRDGANVQLTVPSGESQAFAVETSGTTNAGVSTKAGYRKRSSQETVSPGNYTTSTIGTSAQLCSIAIRPSGGRFPLAARSVNVPQNGLGTSFTPLAPPDYHVGDLLVAIVGYSRQATTAGNVTGPAGWSQAGATTKLENIAAGIGNPSSLGLAIFSKVAAGGHAFAWTFASSQSSIKIQIIAFSAKPTAPSIVTSALQADSSNNTTQTVPALTLADFADDVLLLAADLLDGGPNGFSAPASWTLYSSFAAGTSPANELDVAIRTYSTPNPPSVSWTTVNNRYSVDCQIAIAAQRDGAGARQLVVMV